MFAGSASALSLRMTFNGEDPPYIWYTCLGSKVRVDIYLDGWDTSWFSTEPLLGVQLFLYYDRYHSKVNLENSYPASSFDPSLSFAQVLRGKVKLVAASSECINMSGSRLIWTVELESTWGGWEHITVQMDYPGDGLVVPGGAYCSAPHQLGAASVTEYLFAETDDLNGNGCVDYCECEGDFEPDGDVDGTDAIAFKLDFFRKNCAELPLCNGDFDCDEDVDGLDANVFRVDFFRKDCPSCGGWTCNY